MTNQNKKSLSYKIQKNPFLLLFIIIIFAVVLFAVINISDAIRENNAQTTIEDTTIIEETKQEITSTTEAEAVMSFSNVKKYNKNIVSVNSEKTDTQVTVKAVFNSKDALLTAHYADKVNDVQVAPVFCFYTSDGTQIKCPAEVKILDDGVTAIYYLSNIDDYKNAVALVDEINVDYENILENDFNLYLQHKTEQGTGSTILGTYKEKVEDYDKNKTSSSYVSNLASGIRNVEITKNDKFVWIDIYYDDITSYTSLNYDFITNFVCFGFVKNGSSYKRDFIITEYDNLNMLRCKFDEYSLKELADETGDTDKTVAEMFSDYTISVWSTDYDTETSLFTIN